MDQEPGDDAIGDYGCEQRTDKYPYFIAAFGHIVAKGSYELTHISFGTCFFRDLHRINYLQLKTLLRLDTIFLVKHVLFCILGIPEYVQQACPVPTFSVFA